MSVTMQSTLIQLTRDAVLLNDQSGELKDWLYLTSILDFIARW